MDRGDESTGPDRLTGMLKQESYVFVGMAYLNIEMPECHSLKEKRSVIRPVIKRVQSKFNVSIAEIDDLDTWQVAGLGFVCVSNAQGHAEDQLQTVITYIEDMLGDGHVANVETDVQKF